MGLTLAVGATLASLTLRSQGASTANQVSLVRHATPVNDSSSTVRRWSLHTVHGTVNVRPATLSKHTTWAVFAIDGPTKVVRSDTTKPFVLRLDTRTLANGTYTLTVTVFHRGQSPTFEAITVVVKNTPPQPLVKPAPTMSATPMAATTMTVAPMAVAPQATAAAVAPNTTSPLSRLATVPPAPGQKF
ncbi:hypothetical protein [Frankia canadensis]|uniref:hypothetical protein n=1 Tax=Frankia canadensis TaxID=1836972 RepID=UPI000C7D12A1|nr:hypothetical protein [Frankia canadensis]